MYTERFSGTHQTFPGTNVFIKLFLWLRSEAAIKERNFFVGHASLSQWQLARLLLMVFCLRIYWGIVGLQGARG